MSPISFLREGVKAVPAVRYGIAVGALAAIVAIVAGFQINLQIAVFGTIIILGLMFVMLVFAGAARQGGSWIEAPARVATWCFLALTLAVAALLVSCYFFTWPRPIGDFVSSPTKTALIPTSFSYYYPYPVAGPRRWQAVAGGWVEDSTGSSPRHFEIAGSFILDGCAGSLVREIDRPDFQIFIPSKQCSQNWLKTRNGESEWGYLGLMYNISY